MSEEQQKEFVEGIKAIDGINFKISSQQMTFLFLTKVVDNKTLNIVLTDSSDNFWIGDFDIFKINAIRASMKLQGTYREFFQTMANMLKANHYEIEVGRSSELVLIIEFDLQGILINSRFNIGNYYLNRIYLHSSFECKGKPFKRQDDPQLYYQFLKAFILDLYNAQNVEKQAIESENVQLRSELNSINQMIKDGKLIRSNEQSSQSHNPLELNSAAAKRIKPKTSIFNPQMRRRKGTGAKIVEEN